MKTILYEKHKALNAKITDFGGWEMPLQYKGALQEQRAVREAVGLFDVSHMGRIIVQGVDAEKLLELISTNKIAGKADNTATYTAWCLPSGGCVDDLIIYRYHSQKFFLIVNAGNRIKDLAHLKKYAEGYRVEIIDRFEEDGILALQGPNAFPLMEHFFPAAGKLNPMHFVEVPFENEKVIISSTGYTGAGGYEIYTDNATIATLWEHFLSEGVGFGIEPAGLGARDILRLEMGYALYGHEIDETIAPTESVAAWAVKMDKPEFIGKEALLELAKGSKKRIQQGIILLEAGIIRQGCPIFIDGQQIGTVTSGGFSPTLNHSIGIALINEQLAVGQHVEVAIRKNLCQAEIVALPFINKKS
ncbi:MAG: glycine cleavage system aminomethyltransferase GcvT [Parachlamydiaceae bacterium]|nr:glycine cleavage system aminomethyltransferase GcvT [Parachlamydiaceae bacterium]